MFRTRVNFSNEMAIIFLYFTLHRVCKHYIPVREPQRRVYQRVVEVEYEAVCAPDGRKCTKTRPEYRDLNNFVFCQF